VWAYSVGPNVLDVYDQGSDAEKFLPAMLRAASKEPAVCLEIARRDSRGDVEWLRMSRDRKLVAL